MSWKQDSSLLIFPVLLIMLIQKLKTIDQHLICGAYNICILIKIWRCALFSLPFLTLGAASLYPGLLIFNPFRVSSHKFYLHWFSRQGLKTETANWTLRYSMSYPKPPSARSLSRQSLFTFTNNWRKTRHSFKPSKKMRNKSIHTNFTTCPKN